MSYEDDDYYEEGGLESQEYYDDDNEGELRAEINAFDRVGGAGDLMVTTDLLSQEPIDRFKLNVNRIAKELSEVRNINIDQQTVNILLDSSNKILEKEYRIEFINPAAYILGYIASNGGRELNINSVNSVFKNILEKKLVDGVSEPDIIRYGRFWINLLSNN